MKPLHADCPVTKTALILSDSWTMLIIRTLLKGAYRFCELEKALPGISTRTLCLKLKKLSDDGLVCKESLGHYRLTEKGAGLRVVERALRRYGEQYLNTDRSPITK